MDLFMKVAVLFRLALAVAGFFLGIFFTRELFADYPFRVPVIPEVVFGSIFAVVGLYLAPILGPWIGKGFSSLTVGFARRVANEVINQLRLPQMLDRIEMPSLPTRGGKEDKYLNPMILDTSAIIDGRINNIADSGFLYGTVIVPRFVLAELQHIADSDETLRRNRGRRGFEILDSLKKNKLIKVAVVEEKDLQGKNVDEKIVNLARKLKGKIITTDFNLNKVASTMDVKTLNVNELVNGIKSPMLPGEPIQVKIVQEGKEKNQGVGYLPDGTMIVVENGGSRVGEKVEAIVSRVLQTVAGRMIFVKADEPEQPKIPVAH
jgi:uncharacterized protein YacL